MNIEKIAFIIEEKRDLNLLPLIEDISKKLNAQLKIFTIDPSIAGYECIDTDIFSAIEKVINLYSPDLISLHKENVDVFKRIFKDPEYVKLAKKFKDNNFLFILDETKAISKIGIAIDFPDDFDFTDYAQTSYNFCKALEVKPTFIYSFYEEFYEMALLKTHTEEEAREILEQMKQEKINKIKKILNKIAPQEDYELVVLSGEPKKEIPFYLHENKFDLGIISHHINDEEDYLENIEISIAIF